MGYGIFKLQGYSSQRRIPHSGEPGAIPGNLHKVEDSLGWQNRLIDKASVQFRLTTKRMYHNGMSFFFQSAAVAPAQLVDLHQKRKYNMCNRADEPNTWRKTVCLALFLYFFGGGSRMNANKTIQKLQMAILQQGLAVTVSRRQFFSTKTQHFITITALNIKVLHFFKKKGEWKEQNYEIMSSASQLEIIECLLEIYKAVSG